MLMTEQQLRNSVITIAKKWLCFNEESGNFKDIIDLYNSHKPLAQGYKVKYTDEWCATYVSAVFIKAGLTKIGFTECSCNRMIELYKKAGRWKETDSYVPKPGDIIMYDWQDNGVGDNKGSADHVGIVVSVDGKTINIIEGNKGESVSYRKMTVNGKYIRGYCLPDYASVATTKTGSDSVSILLQVLRHGSKGTQVKTLQILLIGKGYNCGKSGVDGSFGSDTLSAVKKFQSANNLTVDGIVGADTWTKLLKG